MDRRVQYEILRRILIALAIGLTPDELIQLTQDESTGGSAGPVGRVMGSLLVVVLAARTPGGVS